MAPAYKLFCLGNPLLDIQVNAEKSLLDKYGLKPDDAILAGEEHKAIYEDLEKNHKPKYVAGGSAQNTARGAQYVLPADSVVYMGCVGKDKYADILKESNAQVGLHAEYRYDEKEPTGRCAAIIVGVQRSLCTDLGAANCFHIDHLKTHWSLAEAAQFFFTTGFHLTVSPDSMVLLGEHAAKTNKPFVFSLSAPFIMSFFKDPLARVLPFADYILGSDEEFLAYAEAHDDVSDKSIEGVAHYLANMAKTNAARPRTVVVTRGSKDIIVVHQGKSDVKSYPVVKVAEDKIADTNGAGDALAGGFLAGLVEGKDFDTSLAMGQWLASLEIQEDGPNYPQPKQTFKA